MAELKTYRNDGTRPILDSIYEVYRNLGPGLLESIYEEALMIELASRGIHAQRQVPVRATYKGKYIGMEFIIDILVEDSIVLELKSVEELHPVHYKQLLTYLKLADKRLGFLVNFNEHILRNGIKRVVNNFDEPSIEQKNT
jgi:GxxExxY protein